MPLTATRPSRLAAIAAAAGVALLLPVGGAAQTSSTVVSVATEASVAPASNWHPTEDQATDIQRRLKELGFDPGPLDGDIGPRTLNAIRAYQNSIGLKPDGKVTRELYDRIVGGGAAVASAEATAPIETSLPETPVPFSETGCGQVRMWRFFDSFGSSFDLTLRSDGSVEGPTSPGQWSWRTQNEAVEIVYDNGMGQRVTRLGQLQGADRMVGEATDSNGRAWDWNAERSSVPTVEGKFDCQASSSTP